MTFEEFKDAVSVYERDSAFTEETKITVVFKADCNARVSHEMPGEAISEMTEHLICQLFIELFEVDYKRGYQAAIDDVEKMLRDHSSITTGFKEALNDWIRCHR